jgi:serine/threonine protein kinase
MMHDDHQFYIATELLDGGELFDRLVDIGPFSEKNAAKVAK